MNRIIYLQDVESTYAADRKFVVVGFGNGYDPITPKTGEIICEKNVINMVRNGNRVYIAPHRDQFKPTVLSVEARYLEDSEEGGYAVFLVIGNDEYVYTESSDDPNAVNYAATSAATDYVQKGFEVELELYKPTGSVRHFWREVNGKEQWVSEDELME